MGDEINIESFKRCVWNIAKIQESLKSLRGENDVLNSQIKNLWEKEIAAYNKLADYKESVGQIFSVRQKYILLKGRFINLSSEEVTKAVSLRCILRKALAFVKDVLNIPFPCAVTIKQAHKKTS